jgi:hypothetical protein
MSVDEMTVDKIRWHHFVLLTLRLIYSVGFALRFGTLFGIDFGPKNAFD